MIKSTPETIREAKRALAKFMELERAKRHSRSVPADAGAAFSGEDEAQQAHTERARLAAEYAKARNQNFRPLRQFDESNESAREGREAALAYLEKRRRSVIRK